jgi:hypothetical protein
MIEFTLLEIVLLAAVGVFAYFHFSLQKELHAHKTTTAIILLGLHKGKLRTVQTDDTVGVEPVA